VVPAEARQGTVERALDRLYARFGPRIVFSFFVIAIVVGVPTGVLSGLALGRYLGRSASDMLYATELWGPIISVIGLAGFAIVFRNATRTMLAWSPRSPTEQTATPAWHAIQSMTRLAVKGAPFALVPLTGSFIWFTVHFHEPASVLLPFAAWDGSLLFAAFVLMVFSMEMVMSPMLADVARHLPADFEPDTRALSFRTRALAPLPVITFYGILIVGGYTQIGRPGAGRLAIAIGLALLAVAIISGVFGIVARTVSEPIDALVAATDRVRRGYLETSVPVTRADELGRLTASFNDMVMGLREREALHSELRASRERIVTAADAERRRVERDLHDGAQQQIVLAQLKLGRVAGTLEEDPADAKRSITEIRDDLARALTDLRDLAGGLYPQLLEAEGLPGALRQVASRAPIPTTVDADGTGRYAPELEAAVYFCCVEALQNAGKHAGPTATARIALRAAGDGLAFTVSDDGAGFDPATTARSSGLQNMADRLGALGGSVKIESSPGHGTTIAGHIPIGRG
jgi:signal transduction histidine kinase